MMVGDSNSLKFVLSVLNSKLGRILVKNYVTQLQNRQFRMLHQSVVNFPIPVLGVDKQNFFVEKIDKILFNKAHGISFSQIVKELDNMVFSLCSFDKEEINFINSL